MGCQLRYDMFDIIFVQPFRKLESPFDYLTHSQLCTYHLFGLIKTLRFDYTFWVLTLLEMFKDFLKTVIFRSHSLKFFVKLTILSDLINLKTFDNVLSFPNNVKPQLSLLLLNPDC